MPRLPYRLWLLIIFLIAFAISAIGPEHPRDFLLEHTFTAALLAVLVLIDRQPISNPSATLIFIFLLLHVLGAHYTYSYVPYDDWSLKLLGVSITDTFSFQRNHYDRLVHLAFGLLLVYPMREVVAGVGNRQWAMGSSRAGSNDAEGSKQKAATGPGAPTAHCPLPTAFALLVAIAFLGLLSTGYELIEWVFAILMDPEAAELYNGQQGDIWDAQKDMALALGGSILSAAIILAIERRPLAR